MKIRFPNSAFLGNIEPFLREYSPEEPEKLEIFFNQRWISAHPVALCMAAALGKKIFQEGGKIICEKSNSKSTTYLTRMGLFNYLDTPTLTIREHDPSGRFIPLRNIQDNEGLGQFIEELVPLLHSTPEQANAIKFTVSELVRNALEHSGSKTGAMVCAQYFKKSNKVAIGVADTGVGIRETIRAAHAASTDHQAIALALTPGITGTTTKPGGTELNAGAGLFFVKSIAKVNRNFFVIYSGTSFYKLLKTPLTSKIELQPDPNKDRHSWDDKIPSWQGTVVGVDIQVDETQDFTELLKRIREVYRLDAKEKQKEHFKRARFI